MDKKDWRKRFKNRVDLSSRVTHLTKGDTDDEAFENLISILEEKCIRASKTGSNFINGDIPAVCLQEAPLIAIAENLQYEEKLREEDEKQRIRYLGFGIRFHKDFIYQNNGRPVIYDDTNQAKEYLHKSDWWRIVRLDLSDENHMIDWTHEREWRVPGDLLFDYSQCEIIVPSPVYYHKFVEYCLKNNREEILLEIQGIVVMASVYY
ncbi:MAG: hypothetical protein UDR60_06195 [Catenibacterium mitsuokai]|nr:hypothetical protein [Catenibacterium mitsuokai]MEE0334497.1 hypothetical protein [Catenibacterium mitsuokai]